LLILGQIPDPEMRELLPKPSKGNLRIPTQDMVHKKWEAQLVK